MADLWHHLYGDLCALDREVMHAVDAQALLANLRRVPSRRRRTIDTLCGRRARLYTAPTRDSDTGEQLGSVTLMWPPRMAAIRGIGKCPTCAEASKQKRTLWPSNLGEWDPLRPLGARP